MDAYRDRDRVDDEHSGARPLLLRHGPEEERPRNNGADLRCGCLGFNYLDGLRLQSRLHR